MIAGPKPWLDHIEVAKSVPHIAREANAIAQQIMRVFVMGAPCVFVLSNEYPRSSDAAYELGHSALKIFWPSNVDDRAQL